MKTAINASSADSVKRSFPLSPPAQPSISMPLHPGHQRWTLEAVETMSKHTLPVKSRFMSNHLTLRSSGMSRIGQTLCFAVVVLLVLAFLLSWFSHSEETTCGAAVAAERATSPWAQTFREAQGIRREAIDLLFRCNIISLEEFNSDDVNPERIEEYCWVGVNMLMQQSLNDWADSPEEARKNFEHCFKASFPASAQERVAKHARKQAVEPAPKQPSEEEPEEHSQVFLLPTREDIRRHSPANNQSSDQLAGPRKREMGQSADRAAGPPMRSAEPTVSMPSLMLPVTATPWQAPQLSPPPTGGSVQSVPSVTDDTWQSSSVTSNRSLSPEPNNLSLRHFEQPLPSEENLDADLKTLPLHLLGPTPSIFNYSGRGKGSGSSRRGFTSNAQASAGGAPPPRTQAHVKHSPKIPESPPSSAGSPAGTTSFDALPRGGTPGVDYLDAPRGAGRSGSGLRAVPKVAADLRISIQENSSQRVPVLDCSPGRMAAVPKGLPVGVAQMQPPDDQGEFLTETPVVTPSASTTQVQHIPFQGEADPAG